MFTIYFYRNSSSFAHALAYPLSEKFPAIGKKLIFIKDLTLMVQCSDSFCFRELFSEAGSVLGAHKAEMAKKSDIFISICMYSHCRAGHV